MVAQQACLTGKKGLRGDEIMFYGEESVFHWLDLREDAPEATDCPLGALGKNSDATSPLQKSLHASVTKRDC